MSKSPDAFRTISEVAEWLETPAHVLRFWESKFAQVKPVKRAGGRRYYRPNDMLLLGGIKRLLHDDGMTIKGVQKILSEKGLRAVANLSQPLPGEEWIEAEPEAMAEAPAPEGAEGAGEEAPFTEAEPAQPTVVPFTGKTAEAARPPRGGDAARAEGAQAQQETEAAQEAEARHAPEAAQAPEAQHTPDAARAAEAQHAPDTQHATETAQPELPETQEVAPTDAPAPLSGDAAEGTGQTAASASAESAADHPAEDTTAAERSVPSDTPLPEGGLFGETPEFLAKPLTERGEGVRAPEAKSGLGLSGQTPTEPAPEVPETSDLPETAGAATTETLPGTPPKGPLAHLGGLRALTRDEAAALTPLVDRLRALTRQAS
ncbi:MerR family transcriptional regulator [Roseivivax sp.]